MLAGRWRVRGDREWWSAFEGHIAEWTAWVVDVMDAQAYVTEPLVDLGGRASAYEGVLTPEADLDRTPVGLTAQFTTDAGRYARSYASSQYFSGLIRRGFELCPSGEPENILDIGAGAGDNSTFPCLELFPSSRVVATDLSPDLLAILLRKASEARLEERVAPICVDAMRGIFHGARFDFVIGSAILHHLIEPRHALKSAFDALRPGGVAMFFEPFELGHAILHSLFDRITSEASLRNDPLDPNVSHYMHLAMIDIRQRVGRDKSGDHFRSVDDKWLFTAQYLNEIAGEVGFSETRISSIHQSRTQMRDRINLLLGLGAGRSFDALPDWAQHHVTVMDELLAESTSDVIAEGIVVFRK